MFLGENVIGRHVNSNCETKDKGIEGCIGNIGLRRST